MDCFSWEPYSASPSHGSSTQFIATQKVFPGSSPSKCLKDRVGQIGNRWENRVGIYAWSPSVGVVHCMTACTLEQSGAEIQCSFF